MDHNEIADTLDDAADLIERNGWFNTRGVGSHTHGANCAVTAIDRAANGIDNFEDARSALMAYLGLKKGPMAIPNWNNAFDGPQPVLDAMRKCAKELRMLEV